MNSGKLEAVLARDVDPVLLRKPTRQVKPDFGQLANLIGEQFPVLKPHLVREEHSLIEAGIYRRIRHPMYAAMFLLGIAQVLYLANWFAGPTYLLTFGLLYLLRVGRKERMMLDRFGSEYEAYMQRTGRLIPAFRKQPSIP